MGKKVIILVGSGTEKSRSLTLAKTIESSLVERGLDVELIDLLELNLPVYSAAVEVTKTYDAKTQAFLDKSRQADGWVWVTPVYHNSYSSILKTALDWQHFAFDGKVLGMASHGGQSPAAVDQLLMVARAQHFVDIPTRVSTDNSDYDDKKQLVSDNIKQRIEHFADELSDFLKKFTS